MNNVMQNEGGLFNGALCCEDCGEEFSRSAVYLAQKRTDVLYKWKTRKCDRCVEIRVNTALKRIPEILSDLSEAAHNISRTGKMEADE